jgi:predicted ester cyclase
MPRGRGGATLRPRCFHTNEGDVQMGEVLDLLREGLANNDANDMDAFIAGQAPDVEWVTPEGVLAGRDAVREYVSIFRTAFPDGRHTIERALESGSKAAVEGRWTGTHTGPLTTPQGELPPTGRTVTMAFALFVEGDLEARQASRVALYMDQMAMGAQLGLIPEPQATGATA